MINTSKHKETVEISGNETVGMQLL
jgi:hypothetical protein